MDNITKQVYSALRAKALAFGAKVAVNATCQIDGKDEPVVRMSEAGGLTAHIMTATGPLTTVSTRVKDLS